MYRYIFAYPDGEQRFFESNNLDACVAMMSSHLVSGLVTPVQLMRDGDLITDAPLVIRASTCLELIRQGLDEYYRTGKTP